MKRDINTWILPENWKSCGTWGWQQCQLYFLCLELSPKAWRKDWMKWKLKEKSRLSRLQYCWDKPEYWEESWRPEETSCHSGSSEGDGDTNCGRCTQDNPQRISKRSGKYGIKRTNRDHPDYTIININLKTEKTPGHLRKRAVP